MRKLLLTVSFGKRLQLPEICTDEIRVKQKTEIKSEHANLG